MQPTLVTDTRFVLKDGTRVNLSLQHEDLWVFNYPDGGFATITSSVSDMKNHIRQRLTKKIPQILPRYNGKPKTTD